MKTVIPCKKIKAGTYEYRGWVISCVGYYPPEKRVCWEAYDPESGSGDFHGFSKQEIKHLIDESITRYGEKLKPLFTIDDLVERSGGIQIPKLKEGVVDEDYAAWLEEEIQLAGHNTRWVSLDYLGFISITFFDKTVTEERMKDVLEIINKPQ